MARYPASVVKLLLFLSVISTNVRSHAAAMNVTELSCENQTNPVDIDTTAPRFSWILNSDERGQRQTAYRLLVATSNQLLKPGSADLWDSGRLQSDQTVLVEYAGKELHSDQQVYWAVKSWGENKAETEWSAPASFSTALLHPSDCSAKWIATGDDLQITSVPIEMAKWIWSPEPMPEPGKLPKVEVGEKCTFRREFALPGTAISSAIVTGCADNSGKFEVNGTDVSDLPDWEQARQFPIEHLLKPGASNVITMTVTNGGDGPNPAGLVGLVSITFADGTTTQIATDQQWIATLQRPNGAAAPARELGPWGMKPWQKSKVSIAAPPRPIFRKEFALAKPVRRATVHMCGLGQHKLFVNGESASDDFLDPAWAQYPATDFYNTYDITRQLRTGPNAFGVLLANGFYNTAGDRRINGNLVQRPLSLMLQARIEYADGTVETIGSDDAWKWTRGPYTHTSIHGGVDYDARLLPNNWASAGADTTTWSAAIIDTTPHGALTAAMSPPLKTFDEFKPVSITEPKPGHYVYDFGQNASAAPRLRVRGPAGAKLRLTYSEQRQGSSDAHNDGKGLADQSGIRSPNYVEYTLRGGSEESWFSDLFYSGYQYMELTGAVPGGWPNPENKPVVSELTSVHVRSSCPTVGTFACSDPMYERIDRMVDWSVKSNLNHVLTDCPHREKMGWLEVIHLMWPSIASRYDLSRFGPKVARDIRDSQQPSGKIFTVAPAYPNGFPGGFQYTPEWGASGVLIPWYTYQWYGDRRVLAENYDCMHRFVDYMSSTANDFVPAAGLGDWYDYGHGQELGASRFTPTELTAMCIYADCAHRVSQAAAVLGRADDEKKYAQLSDQIRDAFNRHFRVAAGEYKNNGSPQTANSMALVTGMVPPAETAAAVDKVAADMKQRGWQQTAGDVGFHYLVRALADFGRSDALFSMLARTELGSYQYLVNAGWTTLPESWNAYRHYSMNHCMLGHIQEWFSEDLGGIAPDESGAPDTIAYRRFYFKPAVGGPITSATTKLRTPYGEIKCVWKREGGKLTVDVAVPVGSEATLKLPASSIEQVLESGKPANSATGVSLVKQTASENVLKVASGKYHFEQNLP